MQIAIGSFWLLMAALFLTCNSVLMHEGAVAFANTDRLRLILGAVAISTPWILAVLPFQAGISMRATWFGLRRPTSSTLVVFAAYGVFIAYNVLNGSSALTGSRGSIIAERQKGVDDAQALRDKRSVLVKEQDNLPPYRPSVAVLALISAEKQSKRWKNSGECKTATGANTRAYCATVQKLEAEAASAVAGQALQDKIEALDQRLADLKPASAEVDPQAEALARLFSTSPANARAGIGMLGPLALEFGALVWLSFAFKSFGWSHGPRSAAVALQATSEPVKPAALLASPEAIRRQPVSSTELLTAQRKLCEWFFSNCTRPCAGGAMPESDWFDHYEAICRRSNDTPLPIESFRRIASNAIPRMHPVDGVWHYFERVPIIPAEA